MKDAIASTVHEELFGNQFAEFGWAPHDFHYNRRRCMAGYSHPDDPRTMHMGSFNSNLFSIIQKENINIRNTILRELDSKVE